MTTNIPLDTSIKFLFDEGVRLGANIKVLGVGGGGSDAWGGAGSGVTGVEAADAGLTA